MIDDKLFVFEPQKRTELWNEEDQYFQCGQVHVNDEGQLYLDGFGYNERFEKGDDPYFFNFGIFHEGLLIIGTTIVKSFYGFILSIKFKASEIEDVSFTLFYDHMKKKLIPFRFSCYNHLKKAREFEEVIEAEYQDTYLPMDERFPQDKVE